MFSTYNNIDIAGICAAVPARTETIAEAMTHYDKESAFTLKRVAAFAGLKRRHVAPKNMFTGDLAVAAGEYLLNKLNWEPGSINMLFLGTQSPDLLSPPLGYLVAAKLNLSEKCAVSDITTGCPGMVQIAWLAAAHLSPERPRALILCGDTASKFIRENDIGNIVLMGDAVGAMALEYNENASEISFNLLSYPDKDFVIAHYGSGYKPAGKWGKGVTMNGQGVTNFCIEKVPYCLNYHLKQKNLAINDIDVFFMHQPNKRLLNTLKKNLSIDDIKMPLILEDYANCCGASLPLAVCSWTPVEKHKQKAIFCVFGTGLSVASMYAGWEPTHSFGVISVDKNYLFNPDK